MSDSGGKKGCPQDPVGAFDLPARLTLPPAEAYASKEEDARKGDASSFGASKEEEAYASKEEDAPKEDASSFGASKEENAFFFGALRTTSQRRIC